MSKAEASMVKTIDLIQLDETVTVWTKDKVDWTGEVHSLDSIGIALYTPLMGTQFFPWGSVARVVVS